MTAVVCKGDFNLLSGEVGLGNGMSGNGESGWLLDRGSENSDGHGLLYYHGEGYLGHDYQVLQYTDPIDTFVPGSSNHLYRRSGALNHPSNGTIYRRFILASQINQGRIFMGHVRKRSSGPLGAYAPFTYRRIDNSGTAPDTTDYSFSHHGTVGQADIKKMLRVPSFQIWLWWHDFYNALNGNPSTYADSSAIANYVDSDYLFLWLIKHIEENSWNVKNGMVSGLTGLESFSIDGQKSILFSDGTGVYAYTNDTDNFHKMSYFEDSTSYKVRSTNNIVSGWTQLGLHHLYYFPAQGEKEIVYNADGCEVASFAIKAGLNWVCFPVIDDDYGTDPDYTLRDVNSYAMNLQTRDGSILMDPWPYYSWNSTWDDAAFISRTNGYILKMNEAFPEMSGYTAYGTQTPYNTTMNLIAGNENWVPYFLKQSQRPLFAFGGDMQYVYSIGAQDWYIYKFKGQWYGHMQPGATGTLDYVKMYKVKVSQNLPDFRWTSFGSSNKFVKTEPSYFKYEEKPEYQAVVIESIPDEPQFDEIGVFKNGECVGALKFEGYPLNLQIYDSSSPDEFEYMLYSESKHNNIGANKYSSKSVSIRDRVISNGKNQFSIINLSGTADSESIPTPMFSAAIYPNPMQRSANIEIQAFTKSSADITIYNLKGQIVRKMDASELSKGRPTFVWDGKTDDGRNVAQGVYFCKIKALDYTLTKKIVAVR